MTRITQQPLESILLGAVMKRLHESSEVAVVAEMKLVSIMIWEGLPL